jgi:hypothetical protein
MFKLIPIIGLGLSLAILTGCFLSEQRRLDHMWPAKYEFGSPFQLASVQEGYILTKTGDTLRGYIKMVTLNYHFDKVADVPLLPFNKKGETDIIKVPLEDIDYVRIRLTHHAIAEDYMPIGPAMWHILAEKDQIRVCHQPWQNRSNDDVWEAEELILVSGKERIEIPLSGPISSSTMAIRQFINNRYGKQFKKADFKSDQDMFTYIAEEEARRRPQ